jgi:thiol-disulfide isomerase/thioredoxin
LAWESKNGLEINRKTNETMRQPSTISLETEDDLDLFLKNHSKSLVIIDVYQNWCGSCKALVPTMVEMMIQNDRSEERLGFASLETKYASRLYHCITLPSSGVFISKTDASTESNRLYKTPMTKETLSALLVERKSCCPFFLIMKSNQLIGIIEGADAPTFKKFVHDHIPPIEDDVIPAADDTE